MVIVSINPATLETNGEVKEFTSAEVEECFNKARRAQKQWTKTPVNTRARIVVRVNEYLVDHMDDISLMISKEVGKPPYEAFVSEVYTAIDSTFYYYNLVEKIIGHQEEIELGFYAALNKRSYISQKPAGIVAVIGPYNYPFIIPFEQIIQALMAGNAVIFKPSSDTVLVGQKIQEALDSVTDLPAGLMQTVFGRGSTIGNLLVDKASRVVFTGSTETGKGIMKRASETLTPVCLELGGKSAMIVLPDANLKRAIPAARWGCFTNSGQVCSSVKRLFVHESIKELFTSKLVELTKQLRQGNPLDANIDVGAMVNEYQLNKVLQMIAIAKSEGAKILSGGRRNPNLKGYFLEPTILGDCRNEMRCVQEEIFGPVLPIISFRTPEEVVEMVNANSFGLTSSIWTTDIKKGEDLATRIDAGTVMINECVYTFGLAATPWGGLKSSGIGRTHGYFGFLEVMDPIHINIDTSKQPDVWWMPYDKNFVDYMENFKVLAKSMVIRS
jgi:acyl-CoA reductase-like NAD-dependent aldehyde dehydrogenase